MEFKVLMDNRNGGNNRGSNSEHARSIGPADVG